MRRIWLELLGWSWANVETVDKHPAAVKERLGEKGDSAGICGAARKEPGLKFDSDISVQM